MFEIVYKALMTVNLKLISIYPSLGFLSGIAQEARSNYLFL